MNYRRYCMVLGLASCLFVGPERASAQDKDIVVEGKIQIGIHKVKMEAGSVYVVEVKAKGFEPNLTLTGGGFLQNTVGFGAERQTFRANYAPPKSLEGTFLVTPNIFGGVPEGALEYTFTVKTIHLDETPLLKEEKLVDADAKYANAQAFNKTRCKIYSVKLKAGQLYVIDMVATKADGNKIDPYLYLEAPDQSILARDDDGGGFPHARIIIRAKVDGEHRVVATGLSDFSSIGDYSLTVRTQKGEK